MAIDPNRVAATTRRGQAAAESLMVDTFAATQPDPDGGHDVDDDGMLVTRYVDAGTTRGRTQAESGRGDTESRTVTVGNSRLPVLDAGLHIPISATVPAIGWRYRCIAVGAGSDPAGLDRLYEVVDVPAKTFATARRLDVVRLDPREA